MAEAQVIIHNKLGQAFPLPLLNEAGVPVSQVIPARGNLGPMPRSRVSRFTRQLEEARRISIREVSPG